MGCSKECSKCSRFTSNPLSKFPAILQEDMASKLAQTSGSSSLSDTKKSLPSCTEADAKYLEKETCKMCALTVGIFVLSCLKVRRFYFAASAAGTIKPLPSFLVLGICCVCCCYSCSQHKIVPKTGSKNQRRGRCDTNTILNMALKWELTHCLLWEWVSRWKRRAQNMRSLVEKLHQHRQTERTEKGRAFPHLEDMNHRFSSRNLVAFTM